ncbi:hypothetical protein [Ruegeria profundi]|uniref:hypothetical protein n=1 Tax=Ruegeria profundi TaxID=1685378 RepID=UPI003C7E99B7
MGLSGADRTALGEAKKPNSTTSNKKADPMIKAETICKAERIILLPFHVATAAVSKSSTKMIGTYRGATKLEWRFIVRSLGVQIGNSLKSVLTGYDLQELTLQKSEVVVMLCVHGVQ